MADSDMLQQYVDKNLTRDSQDCTRLAPGHKTHWLQAILAHRHRTYQPAELITVRGNWVVFASAGTLHYEWNHDRGKIAQCINALLNGTDPQLQHSARFHLLLASVTNDDGYRTGKPLSLSDADLGCGPADRTATDHRRKP